MFIWIFMFQLTFYQCLVEGYDNNRSKRQTTSNYDTFTKQFQSCRSKTINELPWMLETYKEVSGLEKPKDCFNLCWSDEGGCNVFIASTHGNCHLRKYFDAVKTPIELKESVKFIFESKSNTTFKTPRAVNVTSKALCQALCLTMENCTYSQINKETCITFQYNQTSDNMDIFKIQAIPDAKELPSAFGYHVGHQSWVVCSSNYCYSGDRKPNEKASVTDFNKLFVRERKLFKQWTNWTSYIPNTIPMTTSTGNNPGQDSTKWSNWSDWSSCKISCSESPSQNRSRKCQLESNEGTSTCELGQIQTETLNCDKTLYDSSMSLFNKNSPKENLVWRKQVYMELSETLQNCSARCLMESSKCNSFLHYKSGKCLLTKFDSINSFDKVDLIESIQYLFGVKPSLSLETIKFENFANVSPEKVCITSCLLIDNCMYSSLHDQMCDVKIGDNKASIRQRAQELEQPTAFGLKLSTHDWILCQDLYCLRGENTLLPNSSNIDSENNEMLQVNEINQKILVAMGYNGFGYVNDIEVIDLASPLTGCLDLPPLGSSPIKPSFGGGGLGYDDIPILCGGIQSRACYSLKNGSWQTYPHMLNIERENFQMVKSPYPKDDSKLFIVGGYTLASNKNSTEILTSSGWKLGVETPVEFYHHCVVLINSTTIMAIGGNQFVSSGTYSMGGVSVKTYVFNTETNKWTEGPDLNQPRQLHSCAMIKKDSSAQMKSIIVVGGTFSTFGDSTEILDPGTSQWRSGPDIPVVYNMIDASSIPSTVYAGTMVEDSAGGVVYIGGYDGRARRDIYRLEHAGPDADWELMPQKLKNPKSFHIAFMIPDRLSSCY